MCIHLYQQTLDSIPAPPEGTPSRVQGRAGQVAAEANHAGPRAKPSSWETSGLGDLEPITYLSSQQLSFLSQAEIRPTPLLPGGCDNLSKVQPGSVNPQLKVVTLMWLLVAPAQQTARGLCHALSRMPAPLPSTEGFHCSHSPLSLAPLFQDHSSSDATSSRKPSLLFPGRRPYSSSECPSTWPSPPL